MSGDRVSVTTPLRRFRVDQTVLGPFDLRIGSLAALAALAFGFVLFGGASLDLGPVEARLGLAAGGDLGPYGQVYGSWAPGLWPGQVLPSWLWACGEEAPSAASV